MRSFFYHLFILSETLSNLTCCTSKPRKPSWTGPTPCPWRPPYSSVLSRSRSSSGITRRINTSLGCWQSKWSFLNSNIQFMLWIISSIIMAPCKSLPLSRHFISPLNPPSSPMSHLPASSAGSGDLNLTNHLWGWLPLGKSPPQNAYYQAAVLSWVQVSR